MAIPDYQTCMLPLLKYASDGKIHKLADAISAISDQFNLTTAERETLLPSGTQILIANRVAWAKTYLKKAGLLTDPKRAHLQITDRGRALLKENPSEINSKSLRKYEEFNEFQNKSNQKIHEEKAIAYSGPKLPVIPVINCHPQSAEFRSKAATFGRNRWQETTGIRS